MKDPVPDKLVQAFRTAINLECTLTMTYAEWKTMYSAAASRYETISANPDRQDESLRLRASLTRFHSLLDTANPCFREVSMAIEKWAEGN